MSSTSQPSEQPSQTTTSTPSPVMATEIQSAPNIPPSGIFNFNNRLLPQPIQLPSISACIGSPRSDYQSPSTPPLSSIHHGPSSSSHAQPRSQPRPYSIQSVPIDKMQSPHASFYPSRADSYSPQHSPSLSQLNDRYRTSPPAPPPRFTRDISSRPAAEDHRQVATEHVYVSPSERQRPVFASRSPSGSTCSPPTAHQPQFQSPHYAHSHLQAPALPHYHSSAYAEPLDHTAPSRLMANTAPAPASAQDPEKDLRYELKIRQQPIAARACGFGERDRRVIDPPPIIQLIVRDTAGNVVDLDELRYSLNVVHCTLWNADGTGEETALVQPDRRTTRRLMGQLVASPSVAKDEHDREGCFFCFPDLSCRTHGRYRLRFVLMRIDQKNLRVGGSSPILTDVLSEVFQVYTAKDFPGMRPSSALTRALKLQGCNIQVKKGNEKALARKRLQESSEEIEPDSKKPRVFN